MYNKKLDELISSNNFYAHTKESGSKEPLLSHMKLTLEYYNEIEKNKNLESIIKNIIRNSAKWVTEEIVERIYLLFKSAIYYHDIGKINPNFQTNKMKNPMKTNILGSEHSILSARIYIDAFLEEVKQKNYSKEDMFLLRASIYNFAYIISRHHSKIKDIEEFVGNLKLVDLPEFCTEIEDSRVDDRCYIYNNKIGIYKSLNVEAEEIYILNKLLYSCLVTADYFATYEYMTGEKINLLEKNYNLFCKYKESELISNIYKYKNGKVSINGINKIRSDIFLETEKNIKENLDNSKIYFLEAPTGSGKTNTSINLARILYEEIEEIKSINYVFPFNTLIEQTDDTLSRYFNKNKEYVPINSITSIYVDEEDSLNFEKAYINNLFRNFPIKLISHVNLFSSFFGINKENNYSLLDYINSVVIIDEIQAYKNENWRKFFIMLEKFAECLNIRFIIMSATLPDLSYLSLNKKSNVTKLLENPEKYYNMPEFKNRVEIDYTLLKEKITLEKLKKEVLKHKDKKILIEFIDKKSAREFYNMLKSEKDNVYEITGDDNNFERKKVLEKIHLLEDVIVVATQTIEAGVDIDMDIGYKDISFIDSEEQFLGRINRSSKKNGCRAYFFDYKDASKIYKNDNRQSMDLKKDEYKECLKTKDFSKYFNDLMDRLVNKTSQSNGDNIELFRNSCLNMNYAEVDKELKLIDSNTQQVFFNFDYEIDGEIISGKKVWEEYKELCVNMEIGYAEKQIKLSQIKERLNLFTYTIYTNTFSTKYFTEEFSGIWYVENGDEFIEEGKFNREKYINYSGGIFL